MPHFRFITLEGERILYDGCEREDVGTEFRIERCDGQPVSIEEAIAEIQREM